ncbi:MAG: hypothetical protein HN712_23395 [Gemmatimonadetes bacterium]|jgi:hypothetical protein|nr:hypothetical protein [Gemmatimonadota bacterium]MBT6150195.1 hypothetical protein [Gemmatimonadota bacterium]MBT7863281.1 hypothetical protein [Gemmatimonadota bacterium]
MVRQLGFHQMRGLVERLLVDTHLWVASAAAGLVLFCSQALGLPRMMEPVVMVGAATLLIYRFDGWVDADRPSMGTMPAVLAMALLVWSARQAPAAVLWLVALGAVPCLLYGVRWPGSIRRYRCLREVPVVKPLFVTSALMVAVFGVPLLWSVATTLVIPMTKIGALAGGLWVLLLCNVTLFDLRDRVADARRGLLTLPVLFGNRQTRMGVMAACLALEIALPWLASIGDLEPMVLLPLQLATAATALCAIGLTPVSSRLRYAICVDGIPLLLGASVCWPPGS